MLEIYSVLSENNPSGSPKILFEKNRRFSCTTLTW